MPESSTVATTSDSSALASASQPNTHNTNTGPARDRNRRPWRNKPSNGNSQNNAGEDEREVGGQSVTAPQRPRRTQWPRHDRRERPLNDGSTTDHHGTSVVDAADNGIAVASENSTPSTTGSGPQRRNGPRRGPKPHAEGSSRETATNEQAGPSKENTRGGGRRRQFNSRLTENEPQERPEQSHKGRNTQRRNHDKPDNLTNRLIDALRTPPFVDCPICFNPIRPAQPIWCCSPSLHLEALHLDESDPQDTQYCYTPFHLKCIKSWASKSVKDLLEAYRARGEHGKQGEWRCPGCQRKRLRVPDAYLCFCGSTPDPRPARIATPHSCGSPCSRTRACGHACPLSCHPGPCPQCQIMRRLPCHCGRTERAFRCADLSNGWIEENPQLSCGQTCNKPLGCGKHFCQTPCHAGPCEECHIVESSKCYCGKFSKDIKCGEGEEKSCQVEKDDGLLEEWVGRFTCDLPCKRVYDCGIHECEKRCHPPSRRPLNCPRSPELITHCPCGKQSLSSLPRGERKTCSDPIPTCGNLCKKHLEGCDHVCSIPCHTGPCPPCRIPLIYPCRCGATTRSIPCHETTSSNHPEILCDKPCTALRSCGHHQCNRICCPLASLSGGAKGKGKKKTQIQASLEEGVIDEEGWHECDLVCGRPLGCGIHSCEERDHRGKCPPCLRSSFEEMICNCGRTIIEPPVPCGTRISCPHPCARPAPPCGHPKSSHQCHEDTTPCPPCVYLTTKNCACGKQMVRNVKCSQEKVSCGTTCGKLLNCGFHQCTRLCHGDECGPCTSVCGKPRKLCLPAHHGCTSPCHAPSACSEEEPCRATVILNCPCGRIKHPALCGRSTSNPAGRDASQQPKCTNDCAVAKRNAVLADALGISQETRDREESVEYDDELRSFAKANLKFCIIVEKAFSDFISSDKKSQVLPHTPKIKRKFIHDLAEVYRFDTLSVDEEPWRSVQIIRRIDTRIPKPLLSTFVTQPQSALGKLADLRSTSTPARAVPSATPAVGVPSSSTPTPVVSNGWTIVGSRIPFESGENSSLPVPLSIPFASSTPGSAPSLTTARAMSPPRPQSVGRVVEENFEQVPDTWENDDDV